MYFDRSSMSHDHITEQLLTPILQGIAAQMVLAVLEDGP
jgi:hypothetical protein